jgi:hypothetical protein
MNIYIEMHIHRLMYTKTHIYLFMYIYIKVLAFDMGGGTTDITIMSINEGTYVIEGTGGDIHCGGRDIDVLLLNRILKTLNLSVELVALARTEPLYSQLLLICSNSKELFSDETIDNVLMKIPYFHDNGDNDDDNNNNNNNKNDDEINDDTNDEEYSLINNDGEEIKPGKNGKKNEKKSELKKIKKTEKVTTLDYEISLTRIEFDELCLPITKVTSSYFLVLL